MRYAVNVSMLEQFNRYLLERCTYQQLLDSVFDRDEESMPMRLGTAFHAILEDPEAHRHTLGDGSQGRGYYGEPGLLALTQETLDQALQYVPVLGSREMKGQTQFMMDDGNILVVSMRCDHIVGSSIIDHKSKWTKPPSDYNIGSVVDQYMDSVQGLYYIKGFCADSVQYVIYWMSQTHPWAEIEHIQTVTITAPSNLDEILSDHCKHFYEWAGNVGLMDNLIERAERTPLEIF